MSDYYPSSGPSHHSAAYGARHSSHHDSSARYHPYASSRMDRHSSPYGSRPDSRYGRSGGGRGGHGGSRDRYNDRRRAPKMRNEFGISYGQPGSNLIRPEWEKLTLPEFQKNFYREAPTISGMTEDEIKQWRDSHKMSCVGSDIPRPIRTFKEAGFPPYIMAEIKRAGFAAPTPIQSQGWPMAMSGRDVIGVAETGSGKTLAFLLPSIVHINAQPLLRKGDGPIVLIIAPTRELAVQIESEAAKFAQSSKIKHTCVYGGVPRREQSRQLTQGVEIIICTPGRLLDFLESQTTNLRRVTYLVIDEADRLLDMGFEPQLKSIFSQVRPDRQILMWSATWPPDVRVLAEKFIQGDAIQVAVGSFDTAANHNVTQLVEIVSQFEKQRSLYTILHNHLSGKDDHHLNPGVSTRKCLVFCATKRQCDFLHRSLRSDSWPCTVIHGDKLQYERDQALNDFKTGKSTVMIATDVASRGIHVSDITAVINFDMPGNIEDYVHRIGRTGRCKNKGVSYSLFTKDDAKRATQLIAIMREANQKVSPELEAMANTYSGSRSRYKNSYSKSSRAPTSGYPKYPANPTPAATGYTNGYSYPPPSTSHAAMPTAPAYPYNTANLNGAAYGAVPTTQTSHAAPMAQPQTQNQPHGTVPVQYHTTKNSI